MCAPGHADTALIGTSMRRKQEMKLGGYKAVLKLYREKIEAWAGVPDSRYRGTSGSVHVQPAADLRALLFRRP